MRQRGNSLQQVGWSFAATVTLLLLIISLSSIYTTHSRIRAIFPDAFSSQTTFTAYSEDLRDVASSNVTFVVASRKSDDTSWLEANLPTWSIVRYITDDLNAEVFVPVNKGHEAMVYLTYLIDNYHSLPPISVFSHAERYQWHNDDALFDGARVLSHLQLPYVHSQGYVSLRCAWHYGCPSEIRPFEHGDDPAPDRSKFLMQDVKPYFYKHAFEAMFPGEEVPEVVGAGCCSQFAVSRDRILQRSLGDYQRVRRWLIETDLPDNVSGRIMEYIWHILFGQEAVSCPTAEECYCRVFGKCDLVCTEPGSCENQWFLPYGERLPEGWPERDFDGEIQDVAALREVQDGDYTAAAVGS